MRSLEWGCRMYDRSSLGVPVVPRGDGLDSKKNAFALAGKD